MVKRCQTAVDGAGARTVVLNLTILEGGGKMVGNATSQVRSGFSQQRCLILQLTGQVVVCCAQLPTAVLNYINLLNSEKENFHYSDLVTLLIVKICISECDLT